MSTIGIRQRKGKSSKSTHASVRLSFGEWQEPSQENTRERGSWRETTGEDVFEGATSGKRIGGKEEVWKNQVRPAYEEISPDCSSRETPDPPSEVSESSLSEGALKHDRYMENIRKQRVVDRGKKEKEKGRERGRTEEKRGSDRFMHLASPNGQKARQDKQDLNVPSGSTGVPDSRSHNPTPTPGTRTGTGTREKKFHVSKAPRKISDIKPWTWQFRRSKAASQSMNKIAETTKTAGEGHHHVYKKRPQSSFFLFWTWNWQAPKPVSWIPIYPSYHPERDDRALKIFIAYRCGHRFPTRVVSGAVCTASAPSSSNTSTYPKSASTSRHPSIHPLPSFKIETLRAAARQEGVKNMISPENHMCPNCFIWWQWFAGLFFLVGFWAIFGWFFAFDWPYMWWARNETGALIPRYTMVAQFDIYREGEGSCIRQAMGGFVVVIFLLFVGIHRKFI